MNFIAQKVDPNGMGLAAYAPDTLSMRAIATSFPAGRMEGYLDRHKGYDGVAVGFVHVPTGMELYAYSRWGMVRVGCRTYERNDANQIAEELVSFLTGGR